MMAHLTYTIFLPLNAALVSLSPGSGFLARAGDRTSAEHVEERLVWSD